MKNIQWLLVALYCAFTFTMPDNAYAIIAPEPVNTGSEVWKNVKAREFVKLSSKDYSLITGKKMNVKDKYSYKIMNKRMKQAIKKNPTLTVSEYMAAEKKIGTGWWIVIGIIGALLIVLFMVSINWYE